MKSLSPRAGERVSALRRGLTFAEKLTGRAGRDVAILGELRGYPETALVPHLLAFLFGAPRPVVRAAAEVLDDILRVAPGDDLLDLADACRRNCQHRDDLDAAWHRLRPAEVSRFDWLGAIEPGVVGIASFHANGYVREAAVTRLDAISGGRELPFLLMRLNDWVAPVAVRARQAVERRLVSAYAAAFLESLPVLERLGISRRREHGPLLEQVWALLCAPEQRDTVLAGLAASDRRMRRLCFRLAWAGLPDERPHVLHRALADSDTVIRLEMVASARRDAAWDALAPLLPQVVADRYPAVRREGIAAAADVRTPESDRWLREALLDRNQVAREVARFCLRQRGGGSDFAAFYREHLGAVTPPRQLAAALGGVGETGLRADAMGVVPYVAHPRPSVRAAAVRALGQLDREGSLPVFVTALRDHSPGVSRAARDQLRYNVAQVESSLRETLLHGDQPHARRYAFALLSSLGKWARLPYLLEATDDGDERIRRLAHEHLDEWVIRQNRSFEPPTREEVDLVASALEAHYTLLRRRVVDELRDIVRYWRGVVTR